MLSTAVIWPILIGSILNLDKHAFGPFMVGRPLMVGFVIGFVTGEVYYGTWIGLSVELLWLASIPLGGQLIPNAGLAVGAAFTAWVGSGFGPAVVGGQTEAGLVASFLTVPFWARVFTVIDTASRRLAPLQLAKARADLAEGRDPRFFQRNLWGVGWIFLFSVVCMTAAVAVNSLMLILAARLMPATVLVNLDFLFTFIPFLGLLGMAVGFLETKFVRIYFGGLLAGLLVLSAVI